MVRRRWRVSLVAAVLVVAGAAAGLWGYGKREWKAAGVALKQDRPKDATRHLAVCLRIWPRSVETHVVAARAARLGGDILAAEAHLNTCLQLAGEATDDVRLEFLLLRVQTGEVDTLAGPLFEAVDQGHPASSMILETMAKAYVLRLRYKPGYACLSRWIEFEPNNPRPHHWRGWALERLNNPKAAKADYERALELDPDLVPVRLRIAEMYLEDKQAPEAMPHLERLSRQVPDDIQVQARMGICLFLLGRVDEARRLMEGAVAHLPNDPTLLVALANLDMQEGRAVDAERRLRTVLAADPSDTESLFVLASALQFQGRSQESAEVLAEHGRKRAVVERINLLLKDVADSPAAKPDDYAEIGRLFHQIGREKFGEYYLEKALEGDSANQAAHRALTAYYERKGDGTRAAAHRRQLRSQDPKPAPTDSNPVGAKP